MGKKKNKKPNFLRLFGTLVLIVCLGYFCYMYINQEIVMANQKKQIAQMQQENERLEAEYQEMLKGIDDKNTLEYIDKYMRSHFGMVCEDETRIDIVEGE